MSNHNGTSDKIKGGISKAKGEIKDQVGNMTDNSRLQAEGKKDKVKGEIQEKIGDLKNKH